MSLRVNEFIPQPALSMFHAPEFFRLHSDPSDVFYQWEVAGRAVACIHFGDLGAGKFRSPRRGTFGGLAHLPSVPTEELAIFWGEVDRDLAARGCHTAEVALAPLAHTGSGGAREAFVLGKFGFSASRVDLNYHRVVTELEFESEVSTGNAKRIRKCTREGFSVEHVQWGLIEQVYGLIAANRKRRGFPLTMSLDALCAMHMKMPSVFELFLCRDPSGAAAASAICLRVRPSVLYVFYWGDEDGFQTHSPVTLLAKAIFEYCRESNIGMLDVGTSSIGFDLNEGLAAFKVRLGFQESLKFTMTRVTDA